MHKRNLNIISVAIEFILPHTKIHTFSSTDVWTNEQTGFVVDLHSVYIAFQQSTSNRMHTITHIALLLHYDDDGVNAQVGQPTILYLFNQMQVKRSLSVYIYSLLGYALDSLHVCAKRPHCCEIGTLDWSTKTHNTYIYIYIDRFNFGLRDNQMSNPQSANGISLVDYLCVFFVPLVLPSEVHIMHGWHIASGWRSSA